MLFIANYLHHFAPFYVKLECIWISSINPFLANIFILCPLKIPENLCFFGVFREYKMGVLAKNGLNNADKYFKTRQDKQKVPT